jgi:hypothetical protein
MAHKTNPNPPHPRPGSRAFGALGLLFLAFSGFSAVGVNLVYFSDNGGFYNFDTGTGVSTLRAPVSGTLRFFGMDTRPSDGAVFAVNYDDVNSGLYRVNINTGTFSLIGMTGARRFVAVAFNPSSGQLLGLVHDGELYALNQTTGAATAIGSTGAVNRGLTFSPSGQLYGFTQDGALFRVDPATGIATAVGGTGNPLSLNQLAEDAAFDSAGELFATDFGGRFFRTDPLTGNGTIIGTSGGPDVLGLIVTPVPEPGVAALGLAGLLAVSLRSRRVNAPSE